MRVSPIRELLAARGAVFSERAGVEIPLRFSGADKEYSAVRDAAGLCDFSFMTRYRVPEDGLDVLEQYACGSVANIRFGRVLHTMAVNDDGMLESDVYIANDDENMIMLCESLVDDAAAAAVLDGMGASKEGLEDLSGSTAVFGLDGLNAWAIARDLFGTDVLGLPYLSIENYELDGVEIKLIRGGKTSEFGYLFIVPVKHATAIWERIEKAGEPHGLVLVGTEAHSMLRLDGRFFNIYEEGARVSDPLPLGLQWMIDFDGDDFRGKAAILERRASGLKNKIIGLTPSDPGGVLEIGDEIAHRGETVAKVVAAVYSPTLKKRIGLALFELPYAYSGLTLEGNDGLLIETISMPPFMPKSLGVKLDEM